MKQKTLWYAVSARGQGVVFTENPERNESFGVWSGRIEGCYCSLVSDMATEGILRLPRLSYKDEPVELKLTITYG